MANRLRWRHPPAADGKLAAAESNSIKTAIIDLTPSLRLWMSRSSSAARDNGAATRSSNNSNGQILSAWHLQIRFAYGAYTDQEREVSDRVSLEQPLWFVQ